MTEKECETCNGIGFVRVDRDVFEEGFGRLENCPQCRPEEPEDPEPDPKPRQFDLSWIDYTD